MQPIINPAYNAGIMTKIIDLTEQMEGILTELISKDHDDDQRKKLIEQLLSVIEQMRTHKNADKIERADLYIHVDDDGEEWNEFFEKCGWKITISNPQR
jgi:hypothetical protein